MSYYVWRDKNGNVTSYLKGSTSSPFAIEVSKEEFMKLGFYSEEPSSTSEAISVESIQTEVREILNEV